MNPEYTAIIKKSKSDELRRNIALIDSFNKIRQDFMKGKEEELNAEQQERLNAKSP